MSQEKYMQHYVEILTATMNDCIVRNVSLQANSKIKEELIEQLNEKILEFQEANENLAKVYSELKEQKEKDEGDLITFKKLKTDHETLKSQYSNADVFRKELIKERENHQATKLYYESKIKELNEEMELLKTPVKNKKFVKKNETVDLEKVQENIKELIKDGGNF